MKRFIPVILAALALAAAPLPLTAKDDSHKEIKNTQVLESGTYKVTAHRVDADEKEIYVKTDKGEIVELYFKPDTKLTQGGQEVNFDQLKDGQNLEVTLSKEGNKNQPREVKILGDK
jgi:hypothetical protein